MLLQFQNLRRVAKRYHTHIILRALQRHRRRISTDWRHSIHVRANPHQDVFPYDHLRPVRVVRLATAVYALFPGVTEAIALVRFAPVKFVRSMLHCPKFAFSKFAPVKSASSKFAPNNETPDKFAPEKFARFKLPS